MYTHVASAGEIIEASQKRPVIVFKHSNSCPISAGAKAEMDQIRREVVLVVVQEQRDVSNEIASITSIKHESPQVIIVKDGLAVVNWSHQNIKAIDVERAYDEAS